MRARNMHRRWLPSHNQRPKRFTDRKKQASKRAARQPVRREDHDA